MSCSVWYLDLDNLLKKRKKNFFKPMAKTTNDLKLLCQLYANINTFLIAINF